MRELSPKGAKLHGKMQSSTYTPAINEMFFNMGENIKKHFDFQFLRGYMAALTTEKNDRRGVDFDQLHYDNALKKHKERLSVEGEPAIDELDAYIEFIKY